MVESRSPLRVRLGGAVLAAILLAPTVSAADPPTTDRPEADKSAVVVEGRSTASGPGLSATGAGDYAVTSQNIIDLPTGATSPLTDVLAQAPGVAIDQNQQIHIRNTEGPQFQYQINGVLIPLDINTNPPFLTMINPMFIKRLDLLDGVLPARYSYATGGVVDIQTKDGCDQPGGSASLLFGQRETIEPSAQYAGCAGKLGYYVSGLYDQGNTAFSSATPGPNPIHDHTRQGQGFGYFSYQLGAHTRLSLMLSAAVSDNQLPNQAGLDPQYVLAGVSDFPSSRINSRLNFRDDLGVLALNGGAGEALTWQLAYSAHFIAQDFRPDNAGELIYQGVSSTATHKDVDNTLEGDLTWRVGAHALGAGFYTGDYGVTVDDSSLVFPVLVAISDALPRIISEAKAPVTVTPENPILIQSSTTPIRIISNTRADNVVLGLYLSDLWQITNRLSADLGVRVDGLSGFTNHTQLDPTINLTYQPTPALALHGGYARYMQVPSFQGVSANAPKAFFGTTAEGLTGNGIPTTEDDQTWDVGLVYRLGPRITLSEDNYYELTHPYLDTGALGVVPIFAPFNYREGYIWGGEFAARYGGQALSAYANVTVGDNRQRGVATGQFNFDELELAYINAHYIPLDHQPLIGVSAGTTYRIGRYGVSLAVIYSSGLRGGFADQQQLPSVAQVNASIEREFTLDGRRRLVNRLTLVNLTDTVNLIRPAEGIGIFQSAYGPRFTVLDSVSLAF